MYDMTMSVRHVRWQRSESESCVDGRKPHQESAIHIRWHRKYQYVISSLLYTRYNINTAKAVGLLFIYVRDRGTRVEQEKL